ncbi:MAG: BLUF domain-containing protein [Pseudomonadota bacterium]
MAPAIYSLIYRSYARPPWIGERTLNDIAREANTFNNSNGVSGMLIFSDGVFVQVLEGSTVTILELTAKIAADRRNERLRVLWHGNVSGRRFGQWSMGCFDFSDAARASAPVPPEMFERDGDTMVWTDQNTEDLIRFYQSNQIEGMEPVFTRMRRLT